MSVSSYSSSFKLISNDSALKLYGPGHLCYDDRSKDVVKSALTQLQATPMNPSNINELFFQLIGSFGSARNAIARESNSPNFERFGKKRTDPNPIIMAYANTLLMAQYESYAEGILVLFAQCMEKLDLSKPQSNREMQVIKDGNYSFEFQVLEREDMLKAKMGIVPAYNEMPIEFRSHVTLGSKDMRDSAVKSTYISRELKRELPTVYHQTILSGLLLKVDRDYPFVPKLLGLPQYQEIAHKTGMESLFLQGIARVKVEGKMFATSKFFSWINFNSADRKAMTTNTFIENMKASSKIIVLHQDQFLIDSTLKEIASIFTRAVLWDKKEDQDLIKLMAKFRHLFANCMPYFRGSAGISEWFEKLVYRYHNKNVEYHQSVDLVALTTPIFSKFLQQYSTIVEVSLFSTT